MVKGLFEWLREERGLPPKRSSEEQAAALLEELGTRQLREALALAEKERAAGALSDAALARLKDAYLEVERRWIQGGLERDPRHAGWKDQVDVLLRESRITLAHYGLLKD